MMEERGGEGDGVEVEEEDVSGWFTGGLDGGGTVD